MDECDKWQKSRCKKALLSFLHNRDVCWWYLWFLLFSLKLVKMIQAIKDLANALMPSGKLVLMVDTLLVPVYLFFLRTFLSFLVYDYQILLPPKTFNIVCVCVFSCYISQPLMVDTLPHPFNDEIRGIAHVADVPLGMNVFHWFVSFPFSPFFKVFKVQLTPPHPSCFWAMQGKLSCSTSFTRCSLCAHRSLQKTIKVRQHPQLGHLQRDSFTYDMWQFHFHLDWAVLLFVFIYLGWGVLFTGNLIHARNMDFGLFLG